MQLKTFFAQDQSGNVIANATVRVFLANTETLAEIFTESSDPLPNPFNTGERGLVQFRVANGEYDVRIITDDGEYTQRVEAFDFYEAEIETDSGEQTVPEAINFRVIKGQVGDESVTTSTGTQTVSEALDQRQIVFNSVADMQAAEGLQIGARVECLSRLPLNYASMNPYKGRNTYEIVASGTGAEDGGAWIDLAGSGHQARGLFTNGIVNLTQYGVDKDTPSDTQKIQAAINFSSSAKLQLVVDDIYLVEADGATDRCLTLKTNTNIKGPSRWESGFRLKADDNQAAVMRAEPGAFNIQLRLFCIDGNYLGQSSPVAEQAGLVLGNGCSDVSLTSILIKDVFSRAFMSWSDVTDTNDNERITVNDCDFINFGSKGCQITNSNNSSINNSRAKSSRATSDSFEVSDSKNVTLGICQSDLTGTTANGYRIVNGAQNVVVSGGIAVGGQRGLFCSDSTNVLFNGIDVSSCQDGALVQHRDAGGAGYTASNIRFRAVCFDTITGSCIRADVDDTANGTLLDEVSVVGCDFANAAKGIEATPRSGVINIRERANTFSNVPIKTEGKFIYDDRVIASNFRTNVVSGVTNDSVIEIDAPEDSGMIMVGVENLAGFFGQGSFRVQSTLDMKANYVADETRLTFETGILDPASGPTGAITVSAAAPGKIQIRNRSGSTRTLIYTFINCG